MIWNPIMKEQAFKMLAISSNGEKIMSLKLHPAGNLFLGCLAFCILNGQV